MALHGKNISIADTDAFKKSIAPVAEVIAQGYIKIASVAANGVHSTVVKREDFIGTWPFNPEKPVQKFTVIYAFHGICSSFRRCCTVS